MGKETSHKVEEDSTCLFLRLRFPSPLLRPPPSAPLPPSPSLPPQPPHGPAVCHTLRANQHKVQEDGASHSHTLICFLPLFLYPPTPPSPPPPSLYVGLQRVYQRKAQEDAAAVQRRVASLLRGLGRDPSSIPPAAIKTLCKNARHLQVGGEDVTRVLNECGMVGGGSPLVNGRALTPCQS